MEKILMNLHASVAMDICFNDQLDDHAIPSPVTFMPPDILLQILLFMEYKDAFKCRLICKEMNLLILSNLRNWFRNVLHWEGLMSMGELIKRKKGFNPVLEHAGTEKQYDSIINLLLCHFKNQSMKIMLPIIKNKVKLSGMTTIVNMHYFQYNIHNSIHGQNAQWTDDEAHAMSALNDGMWIVSGMNGNASKIGIFKDENIQSCKVISPQWCEDRNSIIFDMDLCGDIPVLEDEHGKLRIGKGMSLDVKAGRLSSSVLPIKLVTCGNDNNLTVYNFTTRQTQNILQGQNGCIYSCKAINNNQMVSVGIDRSLYLWDLQKLKLLQRIEKIHSGSIYGVVVERDNCAMTYSKDGHLKIFDFREGSLDSVPVFDLSDPQPGFQGNTLNSAMFSMAPVYSADMYLTQVAATFGSSRMGFWDLRHSLNPVYTWDVSKEMAESKITSIACDAGKIVMGWSSQDYRDGIRVIETITSNFDTIYEWRFATHAKIGDHILLKKNANPRDWGVFLSFSDANIIELGT